MIKAHFDGKTLVPEEPVNLSAGQAVRVVVVPEVSADRPLAALAEFAEQLGDGADWPPDGAAQHDHYLYGTPKRTA